MIWQHLKHFNSNEPWGDPARINGMLLFLLDALRESWGEGIKGFIVHCAYEQGGHAQKSQHYLGNAVDFHIVDGNSFVLQIDLMEHLLTEFNVADYVGLGIYPDWNTPGFHLDVRGVRARWGRIGLKYVSIEEAKSYAKIKGGKPCHT